MGTLTEADVLSQQLLSIQHNGCEINTADLWHGPGGGRELEQRRGGFDSNAAAVPRPVIAKDVI
jgi:hypothetical protein